MQRPLVGVRVLDLSRLLPGPFLTSLLAELGADVVKVEPPGVGDEARVVGYAFDAVNAGKRSIVIDLKSPDGVALLLRLAARADVLVESFRPGVLDRLGLSDATLAAANPRLVRCALVGYPPGEHRDDVGHDLNYQALAGLLAATRDRAPPAQLADLGGALYGATAILAALLARERTGQGARLEIALADAARAFQVLPLARGRAGDAEAGEWELTGAIPCYRLYACADGRRVALGCLEPRFWERFVAATGVEEALQYDASVPAHARLEALFATRPARVWVDGLREAGVPITLVVGPQEVEGPSGAASPLTRAPSTGRAPALGEHTDAILREIGLLAAEVDRLRAARVVR